MKRLLILLSACVLSTTAAHAAEWSGTQVMLGYTATESLTTVGDWRVDAVTSLTYFGVPTAEDPSTWFLYGGAELSNGAAWTDILVGYTDFFGDHDASIVAIWGGHGVGALDYDVDLEWISNWQGESAYYGLYSVGYWPSKKLRLDLHAEQVDDLLQYGPGAQVNLERAKFTLRYFNGQGSHALRLAISN